MRNPLDRDHELADVGAAARASWRDDEDYWARSALEHWRHHRSLADVARESMHRGDLVRVQAVGAELTGHIDAVGDDVIRLRSIGPSVIVNLGACAAALRVVTTARAGGTRGDSTVRSLRSALLQLEADATVVTVGTSLGLELIGSLAVGHDQVTIADCDGSTSVPLPALVWARATG